MCSLLGSLEARRAGRCGSRTTRPHVAACWTFIELPAQGCLPTHLWYSGGCALLDLEVHCIYLTRPDLPWICGPSTQSALPIHPFVPSGINHRRNFHLTGPVRTCGDPRRCFTPESRPPRFCALATGGGSPNLFCLPPGLIYPSSAVPPTRHGLALCGTLQVTQPACGLARA